MKAISFTLNTAQSGIVTFTTKKILGSIKAIVINTLKPIVITVSLDSMKNIKLMDNTQIEGENYLPIRTDAIYAKGKKIERFNFSPQTYDINDKLFFEISGEKSVSVGIEVIYNG